jgi:general secretion pathway protein G
MEVKRGFTLIELLTVVAIIGVVLTITTFALSAARSNAVDDRKVADLQTISSALEKYRSDCGSYPSSLPVSGALLGNGSTPSCKTTNVYLKSVPKDPEQTLKYSYTSASPYSTYLLCAALSASTGSGSGCGYCASGPTPACNYSVKNP